MIAAASMLLAKGYELVSDVDGARPFWRKVYDDLEVVIQYGERKPSRKSHGPSARGCDRAVRPARKRKFERGGK